jgi:hypothetical protein
LRTTPDLSSVRDPPALAKLPPEERVAWEKFWNDLPGSFPPRPETAPPREAKR